jgi:hypothetical protein
MPFDKLKYPEELWEERRKRVEESLQAVSMAELVVTLKQHDEEFVDDPWRDEFLRLMQEQPQASFYRAIAQKDVVIYYCRDADFGVWVVPGSGMGPLDETGKRIMKEAIAGSFSGRKIGEKK